MKFAFKFVHRCRLKQQEVPWRSIAIPGGRDLNCSKQGEIECVECYVSFYLLQGFRKLFREFRELSSKSCDGFCVFQSLNKKSIFLNKNSLKIAFSEFFYLSEICNNKIFHFAAFVIQFLRPLNNFCFFFLFLLPLDEGWIHPCLFPNQFHSLTRLRMCDICYDLFLLFTPCNNR